MTRRALCLFVLGLVLALPPETAVAQSSAELKAGQLLVQAMTRAFVGDDQKAIELLEEAVTTDPEDASLLVALADAYLRAGDDTRAAFYAERAIDLAPAQPDVLYLAGDLRTRSSDRLGALEAYETLVSIRPNDPSAYTALGRTLLALEQRVEARDALGTALSLGATGPDVLEDLYRVELALGNLDAAFGALSRLIRMQPDDARLHRWSGELLIRQGEEERARRAFERALTLDPGDRDAAESLAALDTADAPADETASELFDRLAEEADRQIRDVGLRTAAIRAGIAAGRVSGAAALAEDGLLFFPGDLGLIAAASATLMHALAIDDAMRILDDTQDWMDVESDGAADVRGLSAFVSALEGEPGQHDGLSSAWGEAHVRAEALFVNRRNAGDPGETLRSLGLYPTSLGATTALALLIEGDMARAAGDAAAAERAWEAALELAPGSPLLLRRLGRP